MRIRCKIGLHKWNGKCICQFCRMRRDKRDKGPINLKLLNEKYHQIGNDCICVLCGYTLHDWETLSERVCSSESGVIANSNTDQWGLNWYVDTIEEERRCKKCKKIETVMRNEQRTEMV